MATKAVKSAKSKSTVRKVVSKSVAAIKKTFASKKPAKTVAAASVERITVRFDQKSSAWSRINPDNVELILGPVGAAVLRDVEFSTQLVRGSRVEHFCGSSRSVPTQIYVGVATGVPSDVGDLNLATFENLGFDKDNGKFTVEGRPLTKAKALYLGGARFATVKL